MTAKDKQNELLRSCFKPLLKKNGYTVSGQGWYKNIGDFFIIIKLQSFSWNTKEEVGFCFNIGIVLNALLKGNAGGKINFNEFTVQTREDFFLNDENTSRQHRDKNGYVISFQTDVEDLKKVITGDFECHIFRRLSSLKTLGDCLELYGDLTSWGDHLKRVIAENKLSVN